MKSKTLKKNFQTKSIERRIIKESNLKDAIPVLLVENNITDNLKSYRLSKFQETYLEHSGFTGEQNQILYLPNKGGELEFVFIGLTHDFREMGAIIGSLVQNKYRIYNRLSEHEYWNLIFGFLMSEYNFDYYKTTQNKFRDVEKKSIQLSIPDNFEANKITALVKSDFLARDLINMPASDLGPEEFESALHEISKDSNAIINVIKGDELLQKNFPLIHSVGRASISEPRLIELTWGKKSSPAIGIPTVNM